MEAPLLTMKSSLEPPKLLRRPLPPKLLPALNAQRQKTSTKKEYIVDHPAPTRINSAEEPVKGKRPNLHCRIQQEHDCYQAQAEESKNSGPPYFPSKTRPWRLLSHFHPVIDDDHRVQPPPPEFTLNDLIARCHHYGNSVSDVFGKPVLSHQHYTNIEDFIAKLQSGKQSKLHNVVLVLDVPLKSKRIPQQQLILERQQTLAGKEGVEDLEHIDSQYMDIDKEQASKVHITHCDLALLECLVHGGKYLSLKAYFISKLPDLTPLRNTLCYLNLSFNELNHFPTEIYKLENLEVLKLRNNPIKEIPFGIHNLKKLRTFIVSFCLLSSLPDGLFVLPYLQILDVSYNTIASIPNDICNLRLLEFLNVEGNRLPALPCGALKLHLKCLRVGNNAMHPLFWRENTHIEPQNLADLAALSFAKNNLDKYSDVIPKEARQTLQNFKVCDCCRGPLYGKGLCFIRPCEKIFGIRKLPFMFCSCSLPCYENFMRQTESLTEYLYES
ncbi:leucine-rich repeat-containing protein 63 [Pelodytes ibericus]